MKLFSKTTLAAAALLLTAGSAWAYPVTVGSTVKMYNGDTATQYEGYYQADNTGDSAAKFGVFCVELSEYFTAGTTYTVQSISDGATRGGLGGQTTTGYDPISDATRWLYYHFLLQDIQTVTGAAESDYQLQLAFWFLEDELNTNSSANRYYEDYYGASGTTTSAENYVAAAVAAVGEGAFLGDVKVMNLIDACGAPAQSQLIGELQPVPEPSTLLLLGGGIAGLVLARRRASKK